MLLSVPQASRQLNLYQLWLFIVGMGHVAVGGARAVSICRSNTPRTPPTLGQVSVVVVVVVVVEMAVWEHRQPGAPSLWIFIK